MRVAYEIPITSTSTLSSTTTYSSASICTGSLIRRYTDTNGTYLKPIDITYNRMFDNLGYALNARYMQSIKWSNDVDYIFLNHPGAVAQGTNMSMIMAKYTKSTNTFDNLGRILINPVFAPGVPNRTAQSINAYLYRYSSGSVEVNGSGVTGSSTNWSDNRIFQGSRIGFGTTNPSQVTTWYEIADVPTNTNLTISPASINYTASTPYVIEELKLFIPMLHASLPVNGVVVVNGLNESTFSLAGTIVTAYTGSSQDRQRGFYRISDVASGSLIQNPYAIELAPPTSPTSQDAYLLAVNTGITALQYFKFNALYPASQSAFAWTSSVDESFIARTDLFTPVASPQITLKLATTKHGPGSGSLSLYTVGSGVLGTTAGRIYRTDVNSITSGSTSYITDSCLEIPPGSVETLTLSGFAFVDYSKTTDKFYLQGATTAPFNRMTITEYNSSGNQMERQVLTSVNSVNKTSTNPGQPNMFHVAGTRPQYTINTDGDMMYVVTGTGASGTYIVFNVPIGADYKSAPTSKQWVSFPVINTNGALKYYNVYPKSDKYIGAEGLGYAPERIKIFYRTSGIGDDSGTWLEAPENGDMSNITVSTEIQFALAWDVLGLLAIPNRVYGLVFSYEDGSQDIHYQPSIAESDISNNIFAWRQAQLWGSTIPELRIRLYNDDTNNLLVDDDTTSQSNGVFEYSNDNGSTWAAWDDTQDTIGNYIRYTANSLPANTRIRALLTLAL
jgi:hypothetical protein